jgi:cell division protein FtsQ
VPVRKGPLPAWAKTKWGRLLFLGLVVMAVGAVAAVVLATRNFFEHDPRFRVQSASSIQILGNSQLSRADLLSVFGADLGRNIFLMPLARRRRELEQIPWVESATVMRLLPNQIRIGVTERTPIAFVQVGGRIELADRAGVFLEMSPQQMAVKHYGFPVVVGINPGDPLSVRGARMHLFERFIGDLDSTGEHFSAQLSEVDLSDPEDVRATVPASGTDLLLYFGQENFLERWRNYQAHIGQWRAQYPKLAAVDLRYEREVVLQMAGETADSGAQSSAAQPKAALPSQQGAARRLETARRTPNHTANRTANRAQKRAQSRNQTRAHERAHEHGHETQAAHHVQRRAA